MMFGGENDFEDVSEVADAESDRKGMVIILGSGAFILFTLFIAWWTTR